MTGMYSNPVIRLNLLNDRKVLEPVIARLVPDSAGYDPKKMFTPTRMEIHRPHPEEVRASTN
jgi:hypothetical protein